MTRLKSLGRSLPLEHQLSRYVEDGFYIEYEIIGYVILSFGPADIVANGNKYDMGWEAYGFVEFVVAFDLLSRIWNFGGPEKSMKI